jgi:Tol biopolymer transport system component/DNA-binding winged helix-turn-helix (wHTH) protein
MHKVSTKAQLRIDVQAIERTRVKSDCQRRTASTNLEPVIDCLRPDPNLRLRVNTHVAENQSIPRVVRFGVFEANLQTGELRKQGLKLKIPPQSFKVLAILLERPRELITREEIQQRLWPADTFVDFDHSLNTAINKIRETLADNAETPHFIETIPRKGYRFVASLEQHDTISVPVVASPARAKQQESRPATSKSRRWAIMVTAALAALAIGLLFSPRDSQVPPPRILNYTQITNDGADKLSVYSIGSVPPPMVTDGVRLYFNERRENQTYAIAEVSVSGGETMLLPTTFPNVAVVGISPSGSDLLAYTFLAYESQVPVWAVPLPSGSPRRIGTLLAVDADWSADGQILYTSGHDVFTAKSDGTAVHRLASVAGLPAWPRLSPDGRVVRFTEYNPATDTGSLWQVSADGTHLHPLLPGWKHHATECCGNWTPAGTYFLFQSTKNGRTDIWAIREKRDWWHAPTPEPRQLTAGPMNLSLPLVSKDEKRLFALGVRFRGELVRYDNKSRQFVPWLGGISATGLTFSRDGEWVAYASFPEGILWKSRIDGSQRTQLTFPPMEVSGPRWSPDGRRIAFMGREPGHAWKIFAMPSAGGGNPEELVAYLGIQAGPDWSPDGNSIVFAGLPEDVSGDAEATAVHVTDLKSGQTTTLPASSGLYCPRWSPKGAYIAATAANGQRLMLFDISQQKWILLANVPASCATWSRDGKYLYFQSVNVKEPAVYRVSLATRGVDSLFNITIQSTDGRVPWWNELAPDGSPLLLRDESNEEVYSLECELP